MIFEEILPHIRNEEKVRRQTWWKHEFMIKSSEPHELFYLYHYDKTYGYYIYDGDFQLKVGDLMADDWELFKE